MLRAAVLYATIATGISGLPAFSQTTTISPDKVHILVRQRNITGLKELGTGVLPVMARLYSNSDTSGKADIAELFYLLSWPSAEARKVLMQDVHTQDEHLRLQVQWALGRVSGDTDVVDVLLNNMKNDANPLFRDKAACALAYDQIHLTEKQKVRLYEGLIQGLSDPKLDVRQISLLALHIQTGQTKNFEANASPAQREASIREWKRWLEEYRLQW
jgi:hypothetical protein